MGSYYKSILPIELSEGFGRVLTKVVYCIPLSFYLFRLFPCIQVPDNQMRRRPAPTEGWCRRSGIPKISFIQCFGSASRITDPVWDPDPT